MAGKAGKRVGLLTARQVKTLGDGFHGDGGNLYLRVKDGSRTWVFRWQVGGKVKRVGFGPTHTLGLADARERAEDARRQLLDGVDPRQARRAKQVALAAADPLSFDQVAAKYIEANAPSWRNPKHAKQWTSTLEQYASPIIGKLPVHEVETAHVLRIVQPIWHTKNETASRVRGRVEAILGYATALNYRDGANPATWKGHLEHLLPERDKVRKVEHHAALPYAELPTFLRQLRKRYGIGPLALEFAILTAARTGEVLWATWSEVDIAHQLWTIPAERMKAEREHSVPLCDRAVAILREMQTLRHNSPYVFPGARRRKPLSNMALLTVLRRMGRGDLTAHGFRSSFRVWASECTDYQRELIETALAHVVGDKTEQAYLRGAPMIAKRRELMTAWAAYCDKRNSQPSGKSRATTISKVVA